MEENNLSREDTRNTKIMFATKLGISLDDIDSDPTTSKDHEYNKAIQLVQTTINTFVTACALDNNIQLNEEELYFRITNIMVANIDSIDTTNSVDFVSQMIESASNEALDEISNSARNVKEIAKMSVENTNNIYEDTQTIINENTLKRINQEVYVAQSQVNQYIQENSGLLTLDRQFTLSNFARNNLTYDVNVSDEEFDLLQKEAILFDNGLRTYESSFDINDYEDLDLTLDMDFTLLQDNIETFVENNASSGLNGVLSSIRQSEQTYENASEQIANAQIKAIGYEKISNIRNDVDSIIDLNTTADVEDAKHLFSELREFKNTLIDTSDEFNISTIVGKQKTDIENKIKPKIEDAFDMIYNTQDKIKKLYEDLNVSFENDFKVYFDEIKDRVNGFSKAIHNNQKDQNWSETTSFGDTISHTYKEETDLAIETYSINNQTVEYRWDLNQEPDYNVISIEFQDEIVEIRTENYFFKINPANSIMSGENSQRIFFNFLIKPNGLDSDDNNSFSGDGRFLYKFTKLYEDNSVNSDYVEGLFILLEGELIADNITFDGELRFTDYYKELSLDGDLYDSSTDIHFIGDIRYIENMHNGLFAFFEKDKVVSSPIVGLYEIEFNDNTKSLVKQYNIEGNSSYIDNNGVNHINERAFFYTLDERNITCDINNTSQTIDEEYYFNKNITCDRGSVISYNMSDKKITATINGEEQSFETKVEYGLFQVGINPFNKEGRWATFIKTDTFDYTPISELNISNIQIEEPLLLQEQSKFSIDGKLYTDPSTYYELTVVIEKDELYIDDFVLYNIEDSYLFVLDAIIYFSKNFFEEYDLKPYSSNNEFQDCSCVYPLYTQKEEKVKITSVDAKHLSIGTIEDNATEVGDALNINAEISYTHENNEKSLVFNGNYNYKNSSFNGLIDYTINETTDAFALHSYAKVVANGFEPFELTLSGSSSDENDFYAIFSRGDGLSYKLATTFKGEKNNELIQIADSNGVKGEYQKSDDANQSYTITDKDKNPLATFGEDENGNSWEIEYIDGTSETIF
jgi:hypothetical protein